MSRERLYEWVVPLSAVSQPEDDLLDVWDRVEDAMHPRWPDRACQGGASTKTEDRLSLWLYCNRTKAGRIGEYLDRTLGVHGAVRLVADDDEA